MHDKFYVTTPLYYINDVPHIGHAYTTIAADVLARYWRKKLGAGNVFFLTGTDEHGTKIAEAAEKRGLPPQSFADELAPRFQTAWKALGLTPDYFIRTTDLGHVRYAEGFLTRLKQAGAIEKGVYEGMYCIGCERFLTESEMVEGKCPDHPNRALVMQREENYFFKLSAWAEKIKALIISGELDIQPIARRNEIVARLEVGVKDISISRQNVRWGIPVPWDSTQTIYVWVEALLNYASALEINKKDIFWPPTVQLMAKEILWFHAVIWPAMLLAVGRSLPKTIFAHGWFTVEGQKMSKSVGNVIDPLDWAQRFGVDALRYYLLAAIHFGQDGDVSESELKARYQSDLANQLGNLLNRTLNLINKNKLAISPGVHPSCAEVDKHIEKLEFKEALEEIWVIVGEANRYLDQVAPWKLATTDPKLKQVLESVYRRLETIAEALEPLLPATARAIQKQLKTKAATVLFPRLG